MKKEPLKGKWVIEQGDVYQIYGENMDKQELVNQDCQDLFEDIQEAVEWLKKELKRDVGVFIDGVHYRHTIKKINEAFEDVMGKKHI